MAIWHVLPCNDLKEHDESSTCSCDPTVEVLENSDLMVIHNAFDGREAIELFDEIVNGE